MPEQMIFETARLETTQEHSIVVERMRELSRRGQSYWRRHLTGHVSATDFKLELHHPLLGGGATPIVKGVIEVDDGRTIVVAHIRPSGVTLFGAAVYGICLFIGTPMLLAQGRFADGVLIGSVMAGGLIVFAVLHHWTLRETLRLLREAVQSAA